MPIILCTMPFALCAHADNETLDMTAALETWGYSSWQRRVSHSVLNPANQIANLPQQQSFVDARLNIRVKSEAGEVVLRPRVLMQRDVVGGTTEMRGDAYISQGFARIKVGHSATLTGGRQLLTWGPANFRSPSNPFYFDAGRTQPLRDLPGLDLARFDFGDGNFSAAGVYVVASDRQTPSADFSNTGLLKSDYRGDNYLVSAIAAKQKDGPSFLGSFAQLTVSDAVLLYGEFGSGRRLSHATAAAAGADQSVLSGPPSTRAQTWLAGGSYTFVNGQTLSLEYLHDGHGYTSAQERRYFQIAGQAASALNTLPAKSLSMTSLNTPGNGILSQPLNQALGQSLHQAPALLGRDYLSAIWQGNPQDGDLYWRVMLTNNVHDKSGQSSFYIEKNMSNRISLFALTTWNFGAASTEYGSLVRSIATLGAKIFIF